MNRIPTLLIVNCQFIKTSAALRASAVTSALESILAISMIRFAIRTLSRSVYSGIASDISSALISLKGAFKASESSVPLLGSRCKFAFLRNCSGNSAISQSGICQRLFPHVSVCPWRRMPLERQKFTTGSVGGLRQWGSR